jgi:hypothetical protein
LDAAIYILNMRPTKVCGTSKSRALESAAAEEILKEDLFVAAL